MGFLPCRFFLFVNKSPCQFNFCYILSLIDDLFVLPRTLHINLIILVNEFNSCYLTYFITVLDYCKYSCIAYNMEVVSIEKKINHLIFYSSLMTNDKWQILNSAIADLTKKNSRATTAKSRCVQVRMCKINLRLAIEEV